MADASIWSDDWGPQGDDWSGGSGRFKRLPRAAEQPGLGVTLGELERQLDEGGFVYFEGLPLAVTEIERCAVAEALATGRGTATSRSAARAEVEAYVCAQGVPAPQIDWSE